MGEDPYLYCCDFCGIDLPAPFDQRFVGFLERKTFRRQSRFVAGRLVGGIPGAVPIFNVILVMNFMRQMPKEMEEAAWIDGASNIKTLIYIVIPLSVPVIATVMMFSFVSQWNDWFSGLLYMTDVAKYPFQTYIQSTITAPDISNMIDLQNYANVSDKTIKAAQTIVGLIPMIIVYPFVQKYFAAGITLGAVKG